ncbi:MAG: tRNA (adenosine(37)-N6)-threonylcarbamoyltransferase complex transferase subunit TsaD [Candidatus Moranbacteria bacterium]|nr:tRNA (adenosine(37)-N6)-threonylcarbamoyltransferase complex transferase subunit TsaD [Candidatus Moranbacteria bacterium]
MSNNLILSIETSCDDTAISILKSSAQGLAILASEVSSQIKLHAKWGGVVPNLAAREHVKNIDHLLDFALREAGVSPEHIDVIAVTQGPGLIPALLVGVSYAKTLSYLWEKPLLGIHHIEGHIYANFISVNPKSQILNSKQIRNTEITNKKESSIVQNSKFKIQNSPSIKFPILCLVVSGGHTQLVLMKDHLQYEIIGQTLDDAVGEAFDKVARILGIGYPGGPVVSAMAEKFQDPNDKCQKEKTRNQNGSYRMQDTKYGIQFPRPMLNKKNYDFSFSGLKTAVLYETKKHPELLKDKKYLTEICHEFQQATVDVLVAKTIKAAEAHQPKTILLAGGVSANKELRAQLGEAIKKNLSEVSYIIPALSLTGDNAAMIAAAAAFRWNKMSDAQRKKSISAWKTMQPHANLKMK